MENNNLYDGLLIRYLTQEANAEEKGIVESWIAASKENRHYFEQLKHAWQLTAVKQTLDYVLDDLDVDEKWNRFRQQLAAKESGLLAGGEQTDAVYPAAESPKQQSVAMRWLIRVAVAASVVLMIGLGWKLLFETKAPTGIARNKENKTNGLVPVLRHEVNTTGREKKIQLPDGSLIVLANKSEISYTDPFGSSRDISLTGKAFFKVTKDRTRPFTVVSGDISTTALGTEFTITSFRKTGSVIVRLYEGKVVVKAVDQANTRMKNEVYLLPGEEFIYTDGAVVKKAFARKKATAPEKIMQDGQSLDNPYIPENTAAPYFMFNNQPLNQVLDDLAALYNIKIDYNGKDVQDIYFTGKYDRSVAVETILKRIGTLNNLTITKNDTAYRISR